MDGGGLVSTDLPSPHLCVRDVGGSVIPGSFSGSTIRPLGSLFDGQCERGGLHQSSRRHTLPELEPLVGSAVEIVQGEKYPPVCLVPTGPGECYSGLLSRDKSLPSDWSLRQTLFERLMRSWDPRAYFQVALSFSRNGLRSYAFPSFSTDPPSASQASGGRGLDDSIAPHWPGRPWFLAFASLWSAVRDPSLDGRTL